MTQHAASLTARRGSSARAGIETYTGRRPLKSQSSRWLGCAPVRDRPYSDAGSEYCAFAGIWTRPLPQVVENVLRLTLEQFVRGNCAPGSTIVTDAWQRNARLGQLGYEHVVHHLNQLLDPAPVYMPAVHRVAILLKRWIPGTHQGSVSMEQVPFYLDEFVFKRRCSRDRGLVFYRMLQQVVTPRPTTGDQL